MVETLAWVTEELGSKRASLGRLRQMLFGVKTEKLSNLLGAAASGQPEGTSSPAESSVSPGNEAPKKKRKGHGRHSARDYTGANRY